MIDLALQKWFITQAVSANPTLGDDQPWIGWCNWLPPSPDRCIQIFLEKKNYEVNRSYGGAIESSIWFDIRGRADFESELRDKAFEYFNSLVNLQNSNSKTIVLDNGKTIFISLMNFTPPGYVGLDDNLRGHWGFQAKILWSIE
jgi:hypothetical protein